MVWVKFVLRGTHSCLQSSDNFNNIDLFVDHVLLIISAIQCCNTIYSSISFSIIWHVVILQLGVLFYIYNPTDIPRLYLYAIQRYRLKAPPTAGLCVCIAVDKCCMNLCDLRMCIAVAFQWCIAWPYAN